MEEQAEGYDQSLAGVSRGRSEGSVRRGDGRRCRRWNRGAVDRSHRGNKLLRRIATTNPCIDTFRDDIVRHPDGEAEEAQGYVNEVESAVPRGFRSLGCRSLCWWRIV